MAEKRKIFLAIPTLTGSVADATKVALQCAYLEASAMGWEIEECRWVKDSIIHRARNVLMARFLESSCTDIVSVDSDVAWGPGAFTRLMTYRVDFVAGVYRTKNETERYMVHFPADRSLDEKTGLIPADAVPAGFMRQTRECIERMRDSVADDWFTIHEDGSKAWPLFDFEIKDHVLWGEDFLFCRRWRGLGGEIWVDPDLFLQHVAADGTPYSGRLGDYLRRQRETDDQHRDARPA